MQGNIYRLPSARDTLIIRGIDDSLLACVCTSMPDTLRNNLQECLLACFDVNPLQDRDSASLSSEEATFEALHFSWYNRHCTNARSLQIFSCKSMSISFLTGKQCARQRAAGHAEACRMLQDKPQPIHTLHVQGHYGPRTGVSACQEDFT